MAVKMLWTALLLSPALAVHQPGGHFSDSAQSQPEIHSRSDLTHFDSSGSLPMHFFSEHSTDLHEFVKDSELSFGAHPSPAPIMEPEQETLYSKEAAIKYYQNHPLKTNSETEHSFGHSEVPIKPEFKEPEKVKTITLIKKVPVPVPVKIPVTKHVPVVIKKAVPVPIYVKVKVPVPVAVYPKHIRYPKMFL